jgi:SpoVK/Ycf46/Vps4 family AAA+-type ATPase/intein/homing endonuclease
MSTEISLKVAEAIQDDVNKGILRIDSTLMHNVGVRSGDIVEIEGERKTVGIVDRAYPGDIGLNIIRMDGIIRRNAKTGIGEVVKVRKADVKPATKVVIAPARKGIMIKAPPELFQQGLLGRAVVKGDIVALGGTTRRRRAMSDSPFAGDIFSILDESLMGFGLGDIKFIVADTAPKGAVLVSNTTDVIFNPEAVELKEEEKAPEVSYEDIGGLKTEIKKVREMVELPLKHPEIFERLGIEAPKGVLLHGPPGTGKTLLAKAVANETNSNFYLINGPEIMSKFYGQSLPAEEKVLVSIDDHLCRIPIGELVEKQPKGVKAVSFDSEGKIVMKDISAFIKHKTNSKLVEITTRSGRKIKVTNDHSLFTLGSKGIESVKTAELKEGNSFIAVPNKVPEPKKTTEHISLLELAADKNEKGIVIRNIQHLLIEAKKRLGHKTTSKILGCKEKYLYDLIQKNIGVKVTKFVKLMKKANVPVDVSSIQISTKGKSLPAKLTITEELCVFFGLWIAEGSYTNKNEVRLSLHSSELKYFEPLVTKLFGNITIYRKPNSNGADIIICSGILGKIMKLLGFNSGAKHKKIPNFVYNLDNIKLSAFLRGYLSGDGTVNTKTPAPMVEVCTESPELADDICYLFLRFGIVPKIYSRPNRAQKRICFSDVKNLELFKDIGFVQPDKNDLIFEYTLNHKQSRRDRLQATGIVKKIIYDNAELSAWKNMQAIGKEILLKLERPELAKILGQDIYWDKVRKIEECSDQPEYVYDISVPGCENFIAGFGGIFAHNSEENLRKKFEEAEKSAPSIIFIDEIDAIATKREETRGEVEKRVVAQLLALMDGLQTRGRVVVIAASNVPHLLDPALRRPGRFDREIDIGVPDKNGRLEILKIHTRNMPLAKDVDLKAVSHVTHGFVGADLAALAKEAAMIVLRNVLPDLQLEKEEAIPKETLEKLRITQKDFFEALKVVRPSAMREFLVEVPNVKWEDVGGLEQVKQELKEAVEWPLNNPEVFSRLGVTPPKGILLYGPPGTGKTLLAKAVANESDSNFILIKGPELLSKWVGESEKAVRKIFEKARQTSPSIIFFDEIDALAPRRGISSENRVTESVVNQLLTEIDGLEELHNVVIIGATNRPDILDTALLRPGRFDRIILVGAPGEETREKIFELHTKGMPLAKEVNLKELAKKTEGYVGADIQSLCREAAVAALRENMKAEEVKMKHFEKAFETVRPSATKEIEQEYEKLKEFFTKARAKEMKSEKPDYFM